MFDLFRKSKKASRMSARHGEKGDLAGQNQKDLLIDDTSKIKYRVSSCQSIGKERSHNEDSIFIFNSAFLGYEKPIDVGLFIVADGMGGHQHGEEASRIAAQGVGRMILERLLPTLFSEEDSLSKLDLNDMVKESIDHAQELVLNQVTGGGTTLTLVLAMNDTLISAHVGDSRLYLVHGDGKLDLQTRDHSLVNRLVELGEISLSEADEHPQRNVLYRALGQSDSLEADIHEFSIKKGESFLICSDGLWGVLGEQVMEDLIHSMDDFDAITAALVNAANDAGGPDNISVIFVEKLT